MNNKKPLIFYIGASGGIGAPTCRTLVKLGAHVVLVGRDKDKLTPLEQELGHAALAVAADANDERGIREMFEAGFKAFGTEGGVGIVISVGKWKWSSILDENDTHNFKHERPHTASEIIQSNDQMEVSIARPTVVVAAVAQEILRKEDGGCIFNISSHVVHDPSLAGNLSYAGAKSKAHAFIANLGEELSGTGVYTSNIVASLVDTTDNRKELGDGIDWSEAVQPGDIAKYIFDCTTTLRTVPREMDFTRKLKV